MQLGQRLQQQRTDPPGSPRRITGIIDHPGVNRRQLRRRSVLIVEFQRFKGLLNGWRE